jgi:hypothetical protein
LNHHIKIIPFRSATGTQWPERRGSTEPPLSVSLTFLK